MSIAFQGISSAISSGSASSGTITWPGSPSNQLLLGIFGFENVNANSGPWISDTDGATGFARLFYQNPSANGGCGLEVWLAKFWSVGASTPFNFFTTRAFVAIGATYSGQYTTVDGSIIDVVRATTQQTWTGNNPQGPDVYALVNEMVITVGAIQLQSPGYGSAPAGWTKRADAARGGTFGNVEIVIGDQLIALEGDTGAIVWTANAASGSSKGAMATFAVRPAATPPVSTSPYILAEYPAT